MCRRVCMVSLEYRTAMEMAEYSSVAGAVGNMVRHPERQIFRHQTNSIVTHICASYSPERISAKIERQLHSSLFVAEHLNSYPY